MGPPRADMPWKVDPGRPLEAIAGSPWIWGIPEIVCKTVPFGPSTKPSPGWPNPLPPTGGVAIAGGAVGAPTLAEAEEAEEPAEGRAAEGPGQLAQAEYGGGGSLQPPAGAPEYPKAVPGYPELGGYSPDW